MHPSWLRHAIEFVDIKWPHSSPKHRVSIAESLATITPVFLTTDRGAPDALALRSALYGWAFNKVRRESGQMTEETTRILKWVEENTYSVGDLTDAALIRKTLDTLALKIDGTPAAATTVARKRGILYSTLDYAVELKLLDSHPFTHVKWTAPKTDEQVDRRTVINPNQADELLLAVRKRAKDLEAFFGCMYYSALRPEEVLFLSRSDYKRPSEPDGWGWFQLSGSTVALGKDWNGTESIYDDRALKHRAKTSTRPVPIPPALVKLLDQHIEECKVPQDSRIFMIRTGANPGRPVSSSTYTRVWRLAREDVFGKDNAETNPLAKVPYQLRHAAVSLWLNAGVPATQVAEWAGHSLHVLLKVYAKCIDGEEDAARQRIEAALTLKKSSETSTRIPHTE